MSNFEQPDLSTSASVPPGLQTRRESFASRLFRMSVVLGIASFMVFGSLSAYNFNERREWQSAFDIGTEGWHKAKTGCGENPSSINCEFIPVFAESRKESRPMIDKADQLALTYFYAAIGLPALIFLAYGAGIWVWTGRHPLRSRIRS